MFIFTSRRLIVFFFSVVFFLFNHLKNKNGMFNIFSFHFKQSFTLLQKVFGLPSKRFSLLKTMFSSFQKYVPSIYNTFCFNFKTINALFHINLNNFLLIKGQHNRKNGKKYRFTNFMVF